MADQAPEQPKRKYTKRAHDAVLVPATQLDQPKPKRKNGRPDLFREEMCKQAGQLCALGFTEEHLAAYWEIKPQVLSRWKKRNPQLSEAIEKAKINANVSVTQKLFDLCRGGNLTAIIFWLTNRANDVWMDKRAPTVLQQNTTNVKTTKELIGDLTPEDKARMQKNVNILRKYGIVE